MAYATFTRLSDQQEFSVGEGASPSNAPKSFVIGYEGINGYSFARAYAGGNKGQAMPIGSAFQQRQFTFRIRITDTTGSEQNQIITYFRDEDFFTVVDQEHGIEKAIFTVLSVEPDFFKGKDEIEITGMLKQGYMGNSYYNNFLSFNLASGATGTQVVGRTTNSRCGLAVSFETALATAFNPFTVSLIATYNGVSNTVTGTLSSTKTYTKWFLDSARGFITVPGLPNSGFGQTSFITQPLRDGSLSGGSSTFTLAKGSDVTMSITYTALPAAATLRVWELEL